MRISDWSSDVCSSDLELQDLLHDELHRRRISLDGDPHGLETQCLRLRILDAVHSLGGTHRYEVKQRLLGHLDRVQGIPGNRIDMRVTPFLNARRGVVYPLCAAVCPPRLPAGRTGRATLAVVPVGQREGPY